MFSKQNRLREKKDFERVFNKGRSFKEDFLILKFIENNLENSRIGIIVSQKVSKKAVIRNKIKRRIRAIIRENLSRMKRGIDIVLLILPGLEKRNFWELKEIINKVLNKAGILE